VTSGRRAVVRVSQVAAGTAEGDLARRAGDCLTLAGGAQVFFGPLAAHARGERVYQVAVRAGGDTLRAALADRGLVSQGGDDRFSVVLAAGRHPSEILRAAAAVRASVVEITPLM